MLSNRMSPGDFEDAARVFDEHERRRADDDAAAGVVDAAEDEDDWVADEDEVKFASAAAAAGDARERDALLGGAVDPVSARYLVLPNAAFSWQSATAACMLAAAVGINVWCIVERIQF